MVERREVDRAIESPDRRIAGRRGRMILIRRYDDLGLGQSMALCVVVEERADETVVVTVYRSSKLDKYLTGGAE